MGRWTGSWLSGPRAAGVGPAMPPYYPGQRLGLPAEGAGSVAGFGPRLSAWAIDALLSWSVASLLVRRPGTGWVGTLVFGVEVFVLTALSGQSAGMRLRRLRVARLDQGAVGWTAAFLRTSLLVLLVPALVRDRDGRGLHDRASGTVVVRDRLG